jgi:hypothetical protein
MGAEVVQLFPQNSRQWRLPDDRDETYVAYRQRADASSVVSATVCHAPYLINLISPNPVTEARSLTSLIANLRAATALGAFGLVLHPGSHRGVDQATAAARIARRAVVALDEAMTAMGVCRLLLENTAGAGGTVGGSSLRGSRRHIGWSGFLVERQAVRRSRRGPTDIRRIRDSTNSTGRVPVFCRSGTGPCVLPTVGGTGETWPVVVDAWDGSIRCQRSRAT